MKTRAMLALVAAVTLLAVLVPVLPVHASTASCETSQLQQVPGSAQTLAGSVPVVFIHGITSSPGMWDPSSPSSIAGQAARITGISAWTFGYAQESLDWVTDSAIGPSFASSLACLSSASGQKVIVVAHSMGGLATQYALAQHDPHGGTIADHVAELITLGTPYDGSLLLTVMQLLRQGEKTTQPVLYIAAAEAIMSACAGKSSGFCGLLNVMPHPVGMALEVGSAALRQLPPWPPGLPVLDTAGDMNIHFGIGSRGPQVDLGDGPVTLGSATGHDTAGPAVVQRCDAGLSLVTLVTRLDPGPCFHTHLAADPLIISAVLAAIRGASVQKLGEQLVPDPPFGVGYTTSGSYLQVSGIPGLSAVNTALRSLITSDQAAIRANFSKYPPPLASAGQGTYQSEPDQGEISASTALVSVLTPTVGLYPGGNDGAGWVSATVLVPSAKQITLPSLFISESPGLSALARIVRAALLTVNSCVQQAVTGPYGGPWERGFDPTLANYQHFAMTPGGLAIGLGQGQVADEACGAPEVTIRWAQLQPYLSPLATQLISELR
jgi:pimeloyl-ACP methyl ester carboxylesterase